MPSPYSLTPVKRSGPGELVVLGFADEEGAFSLSRMLADMEAEGIIEIGDAVVVTRDTKGKVRLHQSLPLVAGGMAVGTFIGLVAGLLLMNPPLGIVVGAGIGGITGAMGDIGIDDNFMKKMAESITPGSSALFVLVGQRKREEMERRMEPFIGKCSILQTALPAENEERLRNFLAGNLPAAE